ncbi:HORMA domain-containing protein [Melanogaster broomeanus]|nr:HORMA domain-containing protein [Melanogaster broomeanus]
MNLKRGFTNEGDRILDYLEKGIFEAIEKQYLRRFIFAIYLDSKDPNNIVEAYTFNFEYYAVPGTDTVVPIMTLGDQLSKMSLCRTGADPMADALKRGKLPTLGEVKRSLKTLMTTISQMETLPKCRYGNFKLFFNDTTPDDYQPPYFRAGDTKSNRWFFTTHRTGEVPESTTIGNVETGWHSVSMKVVSVSSFLPSSTEDNNAMFTGITARSPPKLTPIEEARLRVEDAQLQRSDALKRTVVWDADEDEDAQGEEVSDDGIVLTRYNAEATMVPIGIRGDDGEILPIPAHEGQGTGIGLAQYRGHSELTPTRVGHLIPSGDMEETQVIPATQEIDMRSPSPGSSNLGRLPSLPPSDIHVLTESAISTQQVDTLLLQENIRRGERNKIMGNSVILGTLYFNIPIKRAGRDQWDADVLYLFDACRCMGYHGSQDKRLPPQFICFDCRLRRSCAWDVIAGKIHADMVSRFQDLALFRRAIKIFEVHQPTTALQFRKKIGCTAALVGQMLTRLEDEGFITTEGAISEDLGSSRVRARKGKKLAKSKGRKTQELQKTKYVFLRASKRGKEYLDYFNPEPQVENRLMGLSKTVSVLAYIFARQQDVACESSTTQQVKDGTSSDTLDLDSQTQEPTQNVLTLAVVHQTEVNLKRKARTDSNRATKKIKVSIGSAVDLCD